MRVHKFYYKNIPNKKIADYMPFINYAVDKFLSNNISSPLIIYTGNQTFKFPKSLLKRFDSKLIKNFNKKGLTIYLYEPLCCYIKGKLHNKCYYSEFSTNDDLTKIRSQELDSIQKIVNKFHLTNVTVYTCDYNVEKYLGEHYTFKIACKDIFLVNWIPDLINICKQNYLLDSKIIEKPFWCGNGRYTLSRHIIMSYLVNFPGNYSWHFKQNISPLDDTQWLEGSKLSSSIKEKIKNGHELLNTQYFFLDRKITKLELKDQETVYIPDIPKFFNIPFIKSYNNCFVGVVNETRFAQPTANISEKLLHCVASRTPFIIVGPPYTLQYIKELGFKTFSDFWNEDYDNEENHTLRLKKLFNVFDYIGSLSVNEMKMLYNQMTEILEHNIQILKTLPSREISP